MQELGVSKGETNGAQSFNQSVEILYSQLKIKILNTRFCSVGFFICLSFIESFLTGLSNYRKFQTTIKITITIMRFKITKMENEKEVKMAPTG